MTANRLSFKFKLHDSRGFLHARHHLSLVGCCALHRKGLSHVLPVDDTRQMLQRGKRYTIAFLQLKQPLVANRNAEYLANQRFMSQASTNPGSIMIPPRQRHFGLLHEIINDTVAARPAIPAVARYDQLIDSQIPDDAACQVDQMQEPALARQRIDNRLYIIAMPIRGRCMEYLGKKLPVFIRKYACGVAQTASRSQDSHHRE